MRRDESQLQRPPADDRPGDRWQCGQACDGSGTHGCHRGPGPRGDCGSEQHPCQPARTFRGRRLPVVTAIALGGVAVLVAATLLNPASFYKPGPLSRAHALILSETAPAQSCAACHGEASVSITRWFETAGSGHHGVTQSDRCMDCHHVDIPASFATSPHNLSRQRLEQIRLALANTEVDSRSRAGSADLVLRNASLTDAAIQCAACHREHRGAEVNLSQLSNAQCQSCHSQTFNSFSDGHPQWDQWPYHGGGSIAFNHASHAGTHFPKAADADGSVGRRFDCAACHHRGESGEPVRNVDYSTACAECHDAALGQQSGERLDLLALPSLSEDAATGAAPWPAAATGFFDGEVSPLLRWLISGDPKVAAALARLPQTGNLASVQRQRADQQRAATEIAIAIRDVLDALALEGVATGLLDRPAEQGEVAAEQAAASMRRVLRSVSPQLLWDARVRWFSEAPLPPAILSPTAASFHRQPQAYASSPIARAAATGDLLGEDDLIDDDLLSGDAERRGVDPLDTDPLELAVPVRPPGGERPDLHTRPAAAQHEGSPPRFEPARVLPDGGWYRDDVRLAISYRGGGHADPVLQGAVELAAALPQDDLVRQGLLSSTAVAACIECHAGALSGAGVKWRSERTGGPKDAFTRFSHRPHFHLPQLSDCTHCHTVSPTGSGIAEGHGFTALQKDLCAACHQRAAAGDSCTQCHLYHGKP